MKSKVLSVWVVALVICCVCGVSQAEISYDNVSFAFSDTDDTTLSFSHGIGGGENRILVVGIGAEDDSVADLEISSVTYDGVAMDLVAGSAAIAGTGWRMKTELYYLLESDLPASGTYTVVVTYTGNVPYKSCGAVSLAGVAQYAREAVQTNSNTSFNSISTNITTLTDGAWLVDVVGCGNPGSFTTTEVGMVERWDIASGSSSAAAATKPVEFASTATMGWEHSSSVNRLAHSVAAFAAAGGVSPYPLGDLNQDTAVDRTDLGLFCDQWLDASCSGPNCADLDEQNGVNGVDFAIMMQNWTGPLPEMVISGYVKTSGSSGISGVSVSANNGGGSDTTDALGYYSLIVPTGWSGRVTPSKAGYTFGPSYRNYTNVISYQTDQDYTGTLQTLSISGYVETSGSSGISGVSVSANNGGGSDITDSLGYYSVGIPYGWSGRVTPSKGGYGFSPPYRDYSNVTSSQSNQDYTGTEQTIFMLVINEFMASNSETYMDDMNEYDDWIEVYNGTDSAIDIGGMYITDDLNEPNKYQIPDDAPGQTTIAAYGYLILWADGELPEGKLHLPFKLSKDGEDVGLFEADGTTMIDGLSFGEQVADISYGRYPNGSGGFKYMGVPTPDAINVDGYAGLVDEVEISHVRGFYDSVFTVELFCESNAEDLQIRYTTDGSEPTDSHGSVYNPSVRIFIPTTTCLRAAAFAPGWKGSAVNTATYIFLDDVKTQDESDAQAVGFPWPNWQDKDGGTWAADYEMDPDIVTDPGYSSRFESAMKQIPTMSIVTDADNLFDPATGIYANPMQYHDDENPSQDWERAISLEYFDPATGEDFQVNCGLRIAGNQSREPDLNPKHSMRIFFKGEFGPSMLDFPFYDRSEVDRFNNISLRAQHHMSWLTDERRAQYVKDAFAQDTLHDMGYLSPDSRLVHLYINGIYWGVYQASERPDQNFLSQHLGDDPDQYDVIEGVLVWDPNIEDTVPGVELKNGLQDCWDYMWAMVSDNDSTNTMGSSEYAELQDYLEMNEFVDYVIYNTFVCNWDWNAKNWYAASLRNPADIDGPPLGKWNFYTWDAEITMLLYFQFHNMPFVSGYYYGGAGVIHDALHYNTEYNRLYGDRVHKLLFNDGVMTEQPNIDRYNARASVLSDAIIGESARWGDWVNPGSPYTPDNWAYEWDRMVNPAHPDEGAGFSCYFPQKTSAAINHYQSKGLYPGDDAPSFSQQGGEISAGSGVTITGSGTIYYTTDSSEPINYGSPISSGSSVTINNSLVLKARAHYGGSDWSALNEATFAAGDLVGDLRITEIMYRPAEVGYPDGPDDPNEEFIELKNVGSGTINLNLVKLTEGVHFEFGSMTLAAGQHVLVVKNITAFEAEYGGGLNIAGEWTGPRGGILSNAGERIRLEDAIGRAILDFSYNDGWRRVTDGDGFSLNIFDENADANLWGDKANWAASKYKGGTPGSDDSGLLAEHSIAINEVLAHTDAYPNDQIELKNTTGGSIDVGNWYLSDDNEDLLKYRIAPGTSIGTGGYLVLTEDDNFGVGSGDPGSITGFALSEFGETVYLTSSDGSVLTGYREQEDFGASENGVSFGRHLKSTLTYNFVAMSSTSFGSGNESPAVGPIVINEIMYSPASGGQNEEYIELRNITGSAVNLYEDVNGTNVGWKFTNGIKYTFSPGISIPGNDYLLIVKTDPAYFTGTLYSVPGGITVLGPYEGRLSNGGEKLELSKPGDLDDWGQQTYIRVDRVVYSDGYHPDNPWETDPWPSSPDAGGHSLNRTTPGNYGNDIANWHAAAPSPGSVNN